MGRSSLSPIDVRRSPGCSLAVCRVCGAPSPQFGSDTSEAEKWALEHRCPT